MCYPLNVTDRAALFSSDDWGSKGHYIDQDGNQIPVEVLFDEAFEILSPESGDLIESVPVVTFNRDEVFRPLRDATVEFTDKSRSPPKLRKFLIGDEVESDEHEFSVRVQEEGDDRD